MSLTQLPGRDLVTLIECVAKAIEAEMGGKSTAMARAAIEAIEAAGFRIVKDV